MNIPSDINPLVRSKTKPEEDSNLTIYEVTTTGSNNLYRVAIGDYEGQTCIIDWGDGSTTETTSSTSLVNYDHTYTTAGTYTVQITGNISLIRFGTASSTYGQYVTKIIQVNKTFTSCDYMFSRCAITTLPEGFTIPEGITNYAFMFYSCRSLTTLPASFTIGDSVTTCRYMFRDCSRLTTLPEGFTIGDSVTTCENMFRDCSSLTTLPAGFTIGDSVTDCTFMFYSCTSLTTNIGNLFTKWTVKSRYVSNMFYNNPKITGTAPANLLWNNARITSFQNCFNNCISLDNYNLIPYSWGGGGIQFEDNLYIVLKEDEEIQLAAIGAGTLTFSSDDLPTMMNLTADGKITNFTENGTYEFNVTCSSNYGSEDNAAITIIVDNTLSKTENNLTSNDSSDFVKVYDQSNNSDAFKAMDGNLTTQTNSGFYSNNSANFRIDFSESIIVSYIELKNGTGYAYNYYLQASNDESEWVRIYSDIIPKGFNGSLIINTNQPFQFYRLIRVSSRILSLHILDNLLLQICLKLNYTNI